VLDVPTQDVISRDNVSVKVNAVLYFRVVQADKSVIQVEDFQQATSQLASDDAAFGARQARPRRDALRARQAEQRHPGHPRRADDAWGIKVSNVEIKHVDLDERHDPRESRARPRPSASGARR